LKKNLKKKPKKKTGPSSIDKDQSMYDALKNHGMKIYEALDKGEFPTFTIPSRSVSNIVYDEKLRQYVLGNNAALRSSKNTSQLRAFSQLTWLAFFCK